MKGVVFPCRLLLASVASVALVTASFCDEPQPKPSAEPAAAPKEGAKAEPAPGQQPPMAAGAAAQPPKYPPFDQVVKDATPFTGFLKLYQKDNRLWVELGPGNYNRDYIVIISIARGIGQGPLLGGMSWGFGDDWLWQFQKVGDEVQVVRRNVRFTAAAGSPEEKAVKLAYTDSVLFSLPVATKSPSGADVVELTSIFMSDLPQISMILPGFSFSPQRSSWAEIKDYKDNVELQVAATYASGGAANFDSVPDSRGVTINVHYSISALPQTGYKPRLADDRIGYFLTVVKDYSKKDSDQHFLRYINRWDLQKADPGAALSPPKKPIVFWLERTIPYKYRKPISDGILEWNKAFEKAGFVNAIEVRQQPDDATWDPEDINYNTFRWITASAGFAMGPSRVNPYTGQILDADIIFDSDFLQFWKDEYETFTPEGVAALTGGPLDLESYHAMQQRIPEALRQHQHLLCQCCRGQAMQLARGATILAVRNRAVGSSRVDLQACKLEYSIVSPK